MSGKLNFLLLFLISGFLNAQQKPGLAYQAISGTKPGNTTGRLLPPVRQKINFDNNWRFKLADEKGAEHISYKDTRWRKLNLPHDWSIEGKYEPTLNGTDWQSGYLPVGIGWYRKSFSYDPSWKNKKIQIQFDGIYLNSEVWINGHLLGKRPNGYIGFVYDLTPHLKAGNNVIAVKVDHSKPLTGRWYTGSGIYRHVYLLVTDFAHIPYSGVYFRTDSFEANKAHYKIDVSVNNNNKEPLQVVSILKNRQGKVVDKKETVVKNNSVGEVTGYINEPEYWSPDNPVVYTLINQLKRNGKVIDEVQQMVGFRKMEFSPQTGFILNDKPIKLKGVCDHQTAGAVGSAVPEDIWYYKLKLLKDMGCNAIRTAHNPYDPAFYAICDTLGLLVLNEAFDGWEKAKARDDYGNYFNEWWKQDLTDFLKRDRNHPSVFMWSIGNEVLNVTQGTQRKLVTLVHELDPYRPVTQGGADPTRNMIADYEKNFMNLDVIGFNGDGEEVGELEKFRAKYPNASAISTEVPHTNQTRGVYRSKTKWRRRDFPAPWEKKSPVNWDKFKHKVYEIPDLTETEVFPEEAANTRYQSSYDNASVRISARKSWQRTESFPWLMGEFRWSAFDYLGESEWPSRSTNSGIIDVAGIPKDGYYLYQSLWSDKPMVHIIPHWTHNNKTGIEIPVVVYTNCDSVELFLNNKSLGGKKYSGEQLVWLVPFAPGKIEAIAFRNNKAVAKVFQQTASQPLAINFSVNKKFVKAVSSEVIRVELDIVDESGTLCPYASNELNFEINGPLKIIGVDNGDPLDLLSYKTNHCKAFRGKAVLLLQPTGKKGSALVTVKSEGLKERGFRFTVN